MRRRTFIAALGGAAATATPATLAARGQQTTKAMRLGYLAQARLPLPIEAMLTGLRELNYVEGQNLLLEYRFEQGQSKSLDELAAELVRWGPAVIVTIGTPAALAAKRATTTIPVVMATVGEVLRTGLVTNLARPGGNITGFTLYADELSSKRLELFKEMLPRIERVAVLGNANNPIHGYYWDDMQPSGRALGLNLRLFNVKELNELSTTFFTIKQEESDSLIVLSDVVQCCTKRHHRVSRISLTARDVRSTRVCRRRRTCVLRTEYCGFEQALCDLDREDFPRC